MASSRLLISGFPEGTTAAQLIIYFQSSKKAGGGDIRNIQMQEGQAEITFEEEGVAERVLGRTSHYFKDRTLEVSLLPRQVQQARGRGLEERGELPATSNNNPELRAVHEGLVSSSGACHGNPTDGQGTRFPPNARAEEASCKVSVTGLPEEATEDLLLFYFENERRSKGGPVVDVKINPDLMRTAAIVTFESAAVAERVVQFEHHVLDSQPITVSFLEENKCESTDKEDSSEGFAQDHETERCLNFYVSGFSTRTTEDTLKHYFENARRSGGGEIQELNYFPEENAAEVTFLEVADYDRLVTQEHRIDGQTLSVEIQEPEVQMPLDSRKLYVEGLNPKTSCDCLKFYLEKFSDVDVKEIQFGCTHDNALVMFESTPDFDHIIDKVNNNIKGLEGFKPRVSRAPISCSVLVTGLSKNTTEETLQLYFEHKKSGGGEVSRLDYLQGNESAIVYFEEPETTESVLKKSDHTLHSTTLTLRLYHPLLEERIEGEKGKRRKGRKKMQREIHMDHDIIAYIKMTHQDELDDLVQRLDTTIATDETTNTVVISPFDQGRNCTQPWSEREIEIEKFLNGFTKTSIDLHCSDKVATEVKKQMHETDLIKRYDQMKIVFVASESSVQFIGREAYVSEVINEFHKLVRRLEDDFQLKKSIIQDVQNDIPKEKRELLEISGFCQELEREMKHLKISVDAANNSLIFEGLDTEIREAKTKIFKLLMTTKELVMELPERCLKVLFSQKGKTWVQKSFQNQGIVATILPGQRNSSNEAMIFGLSNENARKAEAFIQNSVTEFSLPLKEGNAQVLDGQKGKNLLSQEISNRIVGVTIGLNALWVSGQSTDARQCFQRIKDFLDENTIQKRLIPASKGCSQFLFKFWRGKVDGIERKYSIKCKAAAEEDGGIEITGNAENSTRCLEEIQNLIASVERETFKINKPGMGKFFSERSGTQLLRVVEEEHRCTIERKDTTARLEEEVRFEEDIAGAVGGNEAMCHCTYVTPEGRKLLVYKDDLTKHHADAIVNAANNRLQHIGGLAAAIVKEGGRKIQEECDEFVRTNGSLLEGQTYVSKPGNLPCKCIIHAVGPKWDLKATSERSQERKTRQEEMLAYAISNSLRDAKSLSSIAIPAVSSGVFGFPLALCASVIIEAVLAFFKENVHCKLSEVHLTNKDDSTVAQFANEMRKRFGNERTFHDHIKANELKARPDNKFSTTGGRRGVRPQLALTTPEGVNISVKAGDLTKERADVLVGSSGSNLKLDNNPCAKALSQAAGPGLQLECSTKGQVKAGDIAVAGPGNLNCRAVYFAVCSSWTNGTDKGEKVLSGLLKKCLAQAHKNRMASIAFSTIGTGTLQFPCDVVARIYFEQAIAFIKKNPYTTLRDIRFIPFDKDIPTVKAFRDELSGRTSQGPRSLQPSPTKEPAIFSSLNERYTGHLDIAVGSLSFQVQAGDITQESTDAIVVVTNPQLDLTVGGGAGAAILHTGGSRIQDECSWFGNQLPGTVVVTTAGTLPAKQVFHIVPPEPISRIALEAVVLNCLQIANNNKNGSISFPAIGTGNLGMDAKDCAEVLLSSVEKFSQQNPTSLQLVRVTIFQPSMIDAFRSVMKRKSGEKESKEPWLFTTARRAANYLLGREQGTSNQKESASLPAKQISLDIFAGSRGDLNDAVKAINDMMNEHCQQQVITNDAIKMLSDENERRIRNAELRYCTKVEIEKRIGRIQVRGQSNDILAVNAEIHNVIDEIREQERERDHAEQLAKNVQWEFKYDEFFEKYPTDVNAEIERAHAANKPRVQIYIEDKKYTIDFATMKEKSLASNDTLVVRRRDFTKDFVPPDHWDVQPLDTSGKEKEVHLVRLDPKGEEYKRVEQNFQMNQPPPGLKIVTIERVQNPGMYGIYAAKRSKMDERKRSNERWLFHGTAGGNVNAINAKGFNRSYAGAHATVYGKGVYFALDASYSARPTYSPTDPNTGYRYMYLARVLVGEYTVGSKGMLVPPAKQNPDDPNDTYDTVVDQIQNPGIFVAFHDWQYYPDYLITFL